MQRLRGRCHSKLLQGHRTKLKPKHDLTVHQMLDSAGKRVAEQGQLQFLAERRDSDWISLTDAGREFHARDAATGNARSPRVDRRVSGKTSVDQLRSVCPDLTSLYRAGA